MANNGKMEISQPEWGTGIWVPGAFKLDHLQPVKPILFPNFSTFYIFILGSPFLLPQTRGLIIMGRGDSHNSKNGWDWGVSVPMGHSNWTTCSPLSPFLFRTFNCFTFILGSPFLLPQSCREIYWIWWFRREESYDIPGSHYSFIRPSNLWITASPRHWRLFGTEV